jgi:hypothetical protein
VRIAVHNVFPSFFRNDWVTAVLEPAPQTGITLYSNPFSVILSQGVAMRFPTFRSAAAQAAAALCLFTAAVAPAFAAPVKNIVLVHGAFVGGAGWRPVYDILTKDG